ncbi:sigma-70 family RNA polymerase sigma factor [Streptomyces sp. 4R-3d]|uniref:sigma-70 family RNA polymerase sigma factor n=1 Tax=Streptomyces sp. 4R-3d TaxID=2559605 RepID=UPI00107266F1|nr:sigma-70 family RNA polymerase sigma factor [Streptomyces sp. 4R-3d]TFI30190.1 sigma-70 family RNA polymerase sigma factor [Streptomyces sp. 4R-3d]
MAAEDDLLGPRTKMMLQQRAYGWTYRQIGAEHGVTAKRVGQIFKQAREALGVDTVDEAVAQAVSRGLVDVGGEVDRWYLGRQP